MLPYIKKARELGYAVLITNTNDNFKVLNGKKINIKVKDHFSEFKERVFAVAFTDSVHSMSLQKVPKKVIEFLQKVYEGQVADTTLNNS
ncbi:unnamed protein product, partial [Timema podura]|nr:unnamed protein product [Timema podura]